MHAPIELQVLQLLMHIWSKFHFPQVWSLLYKKMKAYGHHFWGDDEIGMLHLFARNHEGMKMNECAWSDPIHVRTLKGEKKNFRWWFNFSLIVLFNYWWAKNMINNRGNPTYKQNEVSFLLAYFQKNYVILMNQLFCCCKFSKFFC